MNNKDLNELNNIKYKSNLISDKHNMNLESKLSNLENFLEEEKKTNITNSWSKMDKNQKMEKLINFAEQYKKEHGISETNYEKLVSYLEECIEKKKLSRTKDIVYDKKTGQIKSIPGLMVNKQHNFTIKNIDNKNSTLRCLNRKTIKNSKLTNANL